MIDAAAAAVAIVDVIRSYITVVTVDIAAAVVTAADTICNVGTF